MKEEQDREQQVAFALRQGKSETPRFEIVRRMQIGEATFCRRKQKFDGLGPR